MLKTRNPSEHPWARSRASSKPWIGRPIRRRGHTPGVEAEHAKAETWLYFYEDFLEVYDNDLRKRTGSYYTPPQVVEGMVGLVDEALRRPGFGLHDGIASPAVTLADPATGTGTFLLGILQRIARTIRRDQGEGAVGAAVQDALTRLIAFELQLGPFAVAQLRLLAEIVDLTGEPPRIHPRMFVTDTLGDPEDLEGWVPAPLRRDRPVPPGGEQDQARPAHHGSRGQPAVQGKSQGTWRVGGRENRKERGGFSAGSLDTPCRLEGWCPCKAPAKPLHLFLALGNVEGLRPSPRQLGGHCLLYYNGGIPPRARFPEDALVSASEV
jgi:hypothetical protein